MGNICSWKLNECFEIEKETVTKNEAVDPPWYCPTRSVLLRRISQLQSLIQIKFETASLKQLWPTPKTSCLHPRLPVNLLWLQRDNQGWKWGFCNLCGITMQTDLMLIHSCECSGFRNRPIRAGQEICMWKLRGCWRLGGGEEHTGSKESHAGWCSNSAPMKARAKFISTTGCFRSQPSDPFTDPMSVYLVMPHVERPAAGHFPDIKNISFPFDLDLFTYCPTSNSSLWVCDWSFFSVTSCCCCCTWVWREQPLLEASSCFPVCSHSGH